MSYSVRIHKGTVCKENRIHPLVEAMAVDANKTCFKGNVRGDIHATLDNVVFKPTKVHDWRNYVPDWAIDVWKELAMETRAIIFMMAEEQAHNEEWD